MSHVNSILLRPSRGMLVLLFALLAIPLAPVMASFHPSDPAPPYPAPPYPTPPYPTTMPWPTGPTAYACTGAAAMPTVSPYPYSSNPIGVTIQNGQVTVTLEINVAEGAVDVYVVVKLPNGQLITIDETHQWTSLDRAKIKPFHANATGPVAHTTPADNLFTGPLSAIPPGTYEGYVVMVPAGTLPATFDLTTSPYYLWCTGATF